MASSVSFLVRASATLHCLQNERAISTLVVGTTRSEGDDEQAERLDRWIRQMEATRLKVDEAFLDMMDFSNREKPGLRAQFRSARNVLECERVRVDQAKGSAADIFAVVSGLSVAHKYVLDALTVCLPSRTDEGASEGWRASDHPKTLNDLCFFLMVGVC